MCDLSEVKTHTYPRCQNLESMYTVAPMSSGSYRLSSKLRQEVLCIWIISPGAAQIRIKCVVDNGYPHTHCLPSLAL